MQRLSPAAGVALRGLALVVLGAGLGACHTLAGLGAGLRADLHSLSHGAGEAIRRPPSRSGLLTVMKPETFADKVSFDGAAFTIGDQHANVYVDRPISTGKRYWEVQVRCGILMTGVTGTVDQPALWGGWGDKNAGVYTWFATTWPRTTSHFFTDWGSGPVGPEGQGGQIIAPRAGAAFGFALDADARTLRTFWDGREGPTLKLAFKGPYYAHSGVQLGFTLTGGQPCDEFHAGGQFLLRRGETRYPPPRGYRPLGD